MHSVSFTWVLLLLQRCKFVFFEVACSLRDSRRWCWACNVKQRKFVASLLHFDSYFVAGVHTSPSHLWPPPCLGFWSTAGSWVRVKASNVTPYSAWAFFQITFFIFRVCTFCHFALIRFSFPKLSWICFRKLVTFDGGHNGMRQLPKWRLAKFVAWRFSRDSSLQMLEPLLWQGPKWFLEESRNFEIALGLDLRHAQEGAEFLASRLKDEPQGWPRQSDRTCSKFQTDTTDTTDTADTADTADRASEGCVLHLRNCRRQLHHVTNEMFADVWSQRSIYCKSEWCQTTAMSDNCDVKHFWLKRPSHFCFAMIRPPKKTNTPAVIFGFAVLATIGTASYAVMSRSIDKVPCSDVNAINRSSVRRLSL